MHASGRENLINAKEKYESAEKYASKEKYESLFGLELSCQQLKLRLLSSIRKGIFQRRPTFKKLLISCCFSFLQLIRLTIVFEAQALQKKSTDGINSNSEGSIFRGHWQFGF